MALNNNIAYGIGMALIITSIGGCIYLDNKGSSEKTRAETALQIEKLKFDRAKFEYQTAQLNNSRTNAISRLEE